MRLQFLYYDFLISYQQFLNPFCSLTTFMVFSVLPNLIALKNIYTLKSLKFIYPVLTTALNSRSSAPTPHQSAPPTDFPNSVTGNFIILITQVGSLRINLDCLLSHPTCNLMINLDDLSSKQQRVQPLVICPYTVFWVTSIASCLASHFVPLSLLQCVLNTTVRVMLLIPKSKF